MSQRRPWLKLTSYCISLTCVLWVAGCEQFPKELRAVAPQRSSVARNKDGVEMIVTATPNSAAPGEMIMYEVTVRTGAIRTPGYFLSATVPNYTTVTLSASNAAACSGNKAVCQPGEAIRWNASMLPVQGTKTYYFAAVIAANAAVQTGARLRSIITASELNLTVYAEPSVGSGK